MARNAGNVQLRRPGGGRGSPSGAPRRHGPRRDPRRTARARAPGAGLASGRSTGPGPEVPVGPGPLAGEDPRRPVAEPSAREAREGRSRLGPVEGRHDSFAARGPNPNYVITTGLGACRCREYPLREAVDRAALYRRRAPFDREPVPLSRPCCTGTPRGFIGVRSMPGLGRSATPFARRTFGYGEEPLAGRLEARHVRRGEPIRSAASPSDRVTVLPVRVITRVGRPSRPTWDRRWLPTSNRARRSAPTSDPVSNPPAVIAASRPDPASRHGSDRPARGRSGARRAVAGGLGTPNAGRSRRPRSSLSGPERGRAAGATVSRRERAAPRRRRDARASRPARRRGRARRWRR